MRSDRASAIHARNAAVRSRKRDVRHEVRRQAQAAPWFDPFARPRKRRAEADAFRGARNEGKKPVNAAIAIAFAAGGFYGCFVRTVPYRAEIDRR